MKLLKIISAVIISALYFSGITAAAADDITIYLNGSVVETTVKPQIIDGTTLVPMRDVAVAMGANVTWWGDAKQIDIYLNDTIVCMVINSSIISKYSSRNSEGQIEIDLENGEIIKTSVPPQIINGSTYIPLRIMAEAFDAEVEWNGETRSITITTSSSNISLGNVVYTVNGNTLTLIGSGAMEDYEGFEEDTYKSDMPHDVKNIVISEGITHIGDYSFANFQNIANISLPGSVTSIGKGAFSHCGSLKTAELNSGLKTIDDFAFSNTNLLTILIPYGVESIGYCAFYACKNLTSITI